MENESNDGQEQFTIISDSISNSVSYVNGNPMEESNTYETESARLHFSRVAKKMGYMSALNITEEVCGMTEKGKRVEFFDKCSMTYIVVCVRHNDSSSSKNPAMDDDIQGLEHESIDASDTSVVDSEVCAAQLQDKGDIILNTTQF